MAAPTFAVAWAEDYNTVLKRMAAAFLSGQNQDATQFLLPVTAPSGLVVGGLAGNGAPPVGSPVLIAVSDGVNVRIPLTASSSADANALVGGLISAPWVFNGTTWDRLRSFPAANSPGVQQVANMVGTPITASSANAANAIATATLAAAAGKTTYITGFTVTASGATAGLAVTVTVAGVITGTMNYTFVFPAGVLVAAQPLIVTFPTPVPASAVNTAIVVTLPASGAGGTNATVNATGFQL